MGLLWHRTYLCMAVVYCLLGMGTVCHAKKKRILKKNTDPPSIAPSKKPKDDAEPEAPPPDPPIASPIMDITMSPSTSDPTMSPSTSDPTKSPTAEPSLLPTASPTTGSPSVSPTTSPTTSPTSSPTSYPTKLADVKVELIPFTLDLTTTGSVSASRLESDLANILTTEVLHRAYPYFVRVDLQATLYSPSERRRDLEVQNIQAVVEGSAWFTDESELPSDDQIDEFLSTYFSIFESDDLTQLLKVGNPKIAMAEFVLEIETTETTSETETSPSNLSPGAIGGLAAAGAALMAAIGILVWQRKRRQGFSSDRIHWRKPASSPARTAAGSPDRDRESYLDPNDYDDLSVDPSLAASSTADSMYTSNSDLNFLTTKKMVASSDRYATADRYDAKRLDAVIQSAQQFSTEGSKKTSDFVGSLGNDFPDLFASSLPTEDSKNLNVPVDLSLAATSTEGSKKASSNVGSLGTDFPDLLASLPSTEDSKNLKKSRSFERSNSM